MNVSLDQKRPDEEDAIVLAKMKEDWIFPMIWHQLHEKWKRWQ